MAIFMSGEANVSAAKLIRDRHVENFGNQLPLLG